MILEQLLKRAEELDPRALYIAIRLEQGEHKFLEDLVDWRNMYLEDFEKEYPVSTQHWIRVLKHLIQILESEVH